MKKNYAKLAARCKLILDKFGDDKAELGIGPDVHTVTACKTKMATKEYFDNDGSNPVVQVGDWEVFFNAEANPVEGERLYIGGDEFVVMTIDCVKPASVVVVWIGYVRKG